MRTELERLGWIYLALFIFTLAVIVLWPQPAPCQTVIVGSESIDDYSHEREMAAHPERWGIHQGRVMWFHTEAAMNRPGVTRLGRKPESWVRWENQVRAYNQAETGQLFLFPWEKEMPVTMREVPTPADYKPVGQWQTLRGQVPIDTQGRQLTPPPAAPQPSQPTVPEPTPEPMLGTIYITRNLDERLNRSPGYWNHVALYVGRGQIVESMEGIGVRRAPLADLWNRNYSEIIQRRPYDWLAGACAARRAEYLVGLPYGKFSSLWPIYGPLRLRLGLNCVSVAECSYAVSGITEPDDVVYRIPYYLGPPELAPAQPPLLAQGGKP